MGYTSQVVLCVAVRTADDAERLKAIWRLNPDVGKYNCEAEWRTAVTDTAVFLILSGVWKWYPNYSDVQAHEHMLETAVNLGDAEGNDAFTYASCRALIGEDYNGVTYEVAGNDADLETAIYGTINLVQHIEVNV